MVGFARLRQVCSLALLIAAALNCRSAYGQAAQTHIPVVHGTSLTNESVDLPEALRGRPGVLVLGFSRGSRDAVAGWGRRLAVDYQSSSTVVYYEMPVLASVPRLMRGIVVRSMRSSVPQPAQERFVPIMDNEAAWRTIVHYDRPDDPYLLIVDNHGDVVWQTQAQPTDGAYTTLKQHVEALLTQSGR